MSMRLTLHSNSTIAQKETPRTYYARGVSLGCSSRSVGAYRSLKSATLGRLRFWFSEFTVVERHILFDLADGNGCAIRPARPDDMHHVGHFETVSGIAIVLIVDGHGRVSEVRRQHGQLAHEQTG